jgi:hypothetical protein
LTAPVTAQPQVAGTRCWVVWKRRRSVGLVLIRERQQVIELLGVEAGEVEIEIGRFEFLQLQGEQCLVPVGPRHRSIHHEAKRLYLRRRPLVAKHHRNFGEAQLARGFEAEVTVHHFAVAAGQHRDLEAELADRAGHTIDHPVVLARIPRVGHEPINMPDLDCQRLR